MGYEYFDGNGHLANGPTNTGQSRMSAFASHSIFANAATREYFHEGTTEDLRGLISGVTRMIPAAAHDPEIQETLRDLLAAARKADSVLILSTGTEEYGPDEDNEDDAESG